MISKKEAVARIFDDFEKKIISFDFKADLRNQYFIRKADEAICIFDFHFYERTNIRGGEKGFLIEPYIWIHVKDVEDIYKKITVNRELKKLSDFITLGNSIANLKNNPDGVNRIRNTSLDLLLFDFKDIDYVASEIARYFQKYAMEYFNTNANVAKADELLNAHPSEYTVHMRNDTYRFIKGLIAAKLTNNQKFTDLFKIYEKLVIERDMPENTKMEMNALKTLFL
jgi:hypothetical protein